MFIFYFALLIRSALTDMLVLINNIFGSNVLPQSKYLFKKGFPANFKPKYHIFFASIVMFLLKTRMIHIRAQIVQAQSISTAVKEITIS